MIPSMEFGGTGRALYFLHANGFPPGCYRALLTQLASTFSVVAMVQRPLWEGSDPRSISDWRPLTADLIQFLQEREAPPAIVVGHSLGAIATLRAALRQPERFAAIILIEPVLLPPGRILLWNVVRRIGLENRHPLIMAAQKRRQSFDDLDRLFGAYRQRAYFRYMDDEALRDYIGSIACPVEGGGYRLCYSVAWETRIYATSMWPDLDIWQALQGLRVPALILRGAETDTFWEGTGRRVRRANPAIQVRTIEEATHLVPLERPAETASMIIDFVSQSVPSSGAQIAAR
jgi:pimeloyl-ACP methyl ester carboxylesterase